MGLETANISGKFPSRGGVGVTKTLAGVHRDSSIKIIYFRMAEITACCNAGENGTRQVIKVKKMQKKPINNNDDDDVGEKAGALTPSK